MALSESGDGPVWFKVYEQGLIDGRSNPQVWATGILYIGGFLYLKNPVLLWLTPNKIC